MLLATPRVILFDLDGTLVDSAPDLAGAMNTLERERGLPLSPYDILRPHASAGARGLIFAAFGILPEDKDYEALRVAFLDIYAANIAEKSHLFSGIANLLDNLLQQDIAWGIVTNKASRFTDALVPQLALSAAACIVSGDTTPHAKPHPAPLLEAALYAISKPAARRVWQPSQLVGVMATRITRLPGTQTCMRPRQPTSLP
jgi:phosphoglycolate phosphatase-like HAD superfamily hydrolase